MAQASTHRPDRDTGGQELGGVKVAQVVQTNALDAGESLDASERGGDRVGMQRLGPVGGHIDIVGVACALVAATCWAGNILLSKETGRRSDGIDGLALARAVGAILVAPFGIADGGAALLRPSILLTGAGVALLSSVINFCLELAALR